MKHLFLCFFIGLLLDSVSVSALEKIKVTCIDAESKIPIPYATVFISKANLFTDTDSSGVFEIDVTSNDSLLVTSIGYNEKKIAVSDVKNSLVVFLQPLTIQLPELFIGERKKMTLGTLKAKKKFDMNSDNCVRYEMATRITVPAEIKRYQLKTISLQGIGFNSENPVRIHIYRIGKYGEPYGELMKKDIVIKENSTRNKDLVINVEEQGIVLEERNFFIGVQWIADSINRERINAKKKPVIGPGIYCSYYISSTISYTRSLKQDGYKWMLQTDGIMYPYDYSKIPVKIDSPMNMLVSCDILY